MNSFKRYTLYNISNLPKPFSAYMQTHRFEGNLGAAARYLSGVRAQTPAYWNNTGVLQWLQGNRQGAADSFSRAGAPGRANAAELLKHLQSIAGRQ